jgi:glycosyltransferase involved in cell wall biosynthesis
VNVSVVIATYGEEHWRDLALSRAYPSAENQGAHEIVVGHDPEGTIASVRNSLAEKTTGDWLCFLDADDELGPGYLLAVARVFERAREPGPFLLTPAVSYWHPGRRRANPPRFLPAVDLRYGNYLVLGTVLSRELFFQVGGFSDYPHGFEDWSLWAKSVKAGAEVRQVKRAVYIAYVNPSSKCRLSWRDKEWQVRMHEQVRRDLFSEEYA